MDDGERALPARRIVGRAVGGFIVVGAVVASVYAYRLNFVNPRRKLFSANPARIGRFDGTAAKIAGRTVELPVVDNLIAAH